jgi:hypothetical protein
MDPLEIPEILSSIAASSRIREPGRVFSNAALETKQGQVKVYTVSLYCMSPGDNLLDPSNQFVKFIILPLKIFFLLIKNNSVFLVILQLSHRTGTCTIVYQPDRLLDCLLPEWL